MEPEAKEDTGVPAPAPKPRVTRAELELARLNTGSQIPTPSDLEVRVWIGVQPFIFAIGWWSSNKKTFAFAFQSHTKQELLCSHHTRKIDRNMDGWMDRENT
jgi:hypothetical protein